MAPYIYKLIRNQLVTAKASLFVRCLFLPVFGNLLFSKFINLAEIHVSVLWESLSVEHINTNKNRNTIKS